MATRSVGRGRNYRTGDSRNTGGGVGRGRGRGAPRSTEEGTKQSRFEGVERRAVGCRQEESLGPTLTMPGGGKPQEKSSEERKITDDLVIYTRQCIGGGAFGSVFKGRFREQPCAVKVLTHHATQLTSPYQSAGAIQDEDLKRFMKECKLLERYTHPNIVRHIETLTDPDNLPLLVMELMDENLTHFLARSVNEPTLLYLQLQVSLCCDVACGLQFLHSNNIVHQDLCSDNVLLKHDGSKLIAAVSDFGISRIIDPDNISRSIRTVSHREAYMPPVNQWTASNIYDSSLDIFSFGVVALQIVKKVPKIPSPKDRDSHAQRIESHPLREVILYCLQEDKDKRPKTAEIYNHLSDLLSTRGGKTTDVQLLGHGRAVAPLQFETEIEQLQQKPHQLKGQKISGDIVAQPPDMKLSPFRQSMSTRDSETTNMLEVKNIPSNVDENHLTLYFRSPSSGGAHDAVQECKMIGHGTARVLFHRPEVARQVLFKEGGHIIEGALLEVKYAQESQYASNKLVIRDLPDGVDKDFLELLLQSTAGLHHDGFSIELENESAVITFATDRSKEELDEIIVKIKNGPKHLVAQRFKVSTSVRIQNITEHYSKEFIKLYFESPESGGGRVASVELPGNGEAVVAFSDHRVVDTVLMKVHDVLGKGVSLTREDPNKTLPPPPISHPLQITVHPLIARALQKSPGGLQDKLKLWNAHLSSIDETQGTIVITPTANTKPGWEEKCKDCIQSEYTAVEEQIPKQALVHVYRVISNTQHEVPFTCEVSHDETVLKAAGDINAIKRLRTTIEEHTQTNEEVALYPEDYEFVSRVKLTQIKGAHPDVTISLIPQKQSLLLNGPACSVNQLQQSLHSYAQHTSIPVQANRQIISYLSTECGRQELHKLIALLQCQVAVYFNQHQSQLTVQLLCVPEHTVQCQALAQGIEKETMVKTLPIPKLLAPVLSTLEDYQQLSLELQREHGVKIDTSNQQVTLVGFQKGVVISEQSLNSFMDQTCDLVQPLQITVGTLVGKTLYKKQEGLQNVLQGHLHVKLTIDRSQGVVVVSPTQYMKFNWQEECEQQIVSYVKSITSEIPIPKQGISDIKAFLLSKHQEDILFGSELNSDQDPALLTVIADSSTLETIKAKAEELWSDYDVTNCQEVLLPERYTFVSQVKQQQICACYPQLRITFNQPTNSIHLHGSRRSVNQLKQELASHVRHERVQVNMLDPLIVRHLDTSTGLQQLKQLFHEKQWPTVAFHFERVSHFQHAYALWLLCDPDDIDSVQDVVEPLQKEFVVVSLSIPGTFTSLDPQARFFEEYKQLCQNLESKHQVVVEDQHLSHNVKVAGLASSVNFSVKEIVKFFKRVCTVTKQTQVDRGIWRLFQSYMQPQWSKIISDYEQNGVDFIPLDEEANTVTIKLKGDREEVNRMIEEIKDLVDSVAKVSMPLNRPGTCRYFQEENTQILMKVIETNNKVCIEITEVDKSEPMETEDSPADSAFTTVCVAHIPAPTKELKQIIVRVGDITNFRGDVIVNAANGSLQHSGGVAKAISNKGGPRIQQDSDNYIRMNVEVDVGNAVLFTNTGHLPCKALIHAVGPQWQDGKHYEEYLLEKACNQSLEIALRYQSIAIPAISAGIFEFPIDLAAAALVKSAVEFLTTRATTNIKEINFVLIDHDKAEEFVKALSKNVKVPSPNIVRHTPVPVASAATPSGQYSQKKKGQHKKKTQASPHDFSKLKLHQGSLLDLKADVYVNTTNEKLDLTKGGLSPVLLKAAGQTLQDECKKRSPLQRGDIAVTSGGNLKCKYVFHVVGENFDGRGGKGEKVLRTLVKKCIDKCTKRKVTSIAFPAIGTGNLNFPPDVVAEVMLDEASRLLAKKSTSTISDVHFVIRVQDTLIFQAFQQAITRLSQPHTWPAPASPLLSISSKSKQQGHEAGFASGASPTSNIVCFDISGLNVDLVHGDITDDDSDVVVNTTNTDLKLGGSGVAGALLQKGGPELQELCDEAVSHGSKLKEGQVIVTKATGRLKFQSVFHVAFTSQDTKAFFKIIHACLKKAEDLQHSSIAFPAIGTGAHGYPAPAAAKGMKEAIEKFADTNPSYIAHIRIIIFQQQVHQTFVTEFSTLPTFEESGQDTSEEEESQPSSGPHIFQRIYGGVKQGASAIVQPIVQRFFGDDEPPDEDDITADDDYHFQSSETMNKELELKIYGEKDASVKNAVQRIQKLIKDTFIKRTIALTAELPPTVITQLKKESKAREVQIDFDIPMSSITLKGDKTDVVDMKDCISQELAMVKVQESKRCAAEGLQKIVQWKRQTGSQELDYDCDENYAIEQAYSKGREVYVHRSTTVHFTIDFKRSMEIDHNANKTYKIKRVDLLKVSEKPSHWDKMPLDPQSGKEVALHCVDLIQGSMEYNEVMLEFNTTMAPGGNPGYNSIVKIQRIQNPMLYSQYIIKKKNMDKDNPPGHKNEWRLFHGTPANICPKINKQGFNRSFAGKNATAFGRGVYFARDASYSSQSTYSPPDANGCKYIYLARVLAGEFVVGNSSMIVPPPKDPQDQAILFDSVVDNTFNPQIFVVFHDAQAYPEYLIVLD